MLKLLLFKKNINNSDRNVNIEVTVNKSVSIFLPIIIKLVWRIYNTPHICGHENYAVEFL